MDPKQNQGQGLILTIGQESILPSAIKPRHLLSSPVIDGDLYYSANGSFARIPVGKTGQQLIVIGGVPTWGNFPLSGLAANRPTSGRFTGDQYLNTDTPSLSVWTGSAWKSTTLS